MVYIFLADGFEEVEAFTAIDYLRRADIEVCTVGIASKQVVGSHKIKVETDITINESDPNLADMIVLPGGKKGTENLLKSPFAVNAIRFCTKEKSIAAICAAPMILGKLKLLYGKNAICYPGFEQYLFGATIVLQPVVIDGNIITAIGAGASQQFAFAIISYLMGEEMAEKIKTQVQY